MFFKKRERRKNLKLRKLIDDNEKIASEVRELIPKLTATINGDEFWLDRKELKVKKESDDGCSCDCVLDNLSEFGS